MNTTPSNMNSSRPGSGKSIGVGLTRSKLGAGVQTPSTVLSPGLTTPTRVSTLTRPRSERYQSAYSRLSGLRNTSAPNVNSLLEKTRTTDEETVDSIDTTDGYVIPGQRDSKSSYISNKTVGRAESLKDHYLSASAARLGELKPGRRIQPSFIRTPVSIDTPAPRVLLPQSHSDTSVSAGSEAIADSTEELVTTDTNQHTINQPRIQNSSGNYDYPANNIKQDSINAINTNQRTAYYEASKNVTTLENTLNTNNRTTDTPITANQMPLDTAVKDNLDTAVSTGNRTLDTAVTANQIPLDTAVKETLDTAVNTNKRTVNTAATVNQRPLDTVTNGNKRIIGSVENINQRFPRTILNANQRNVDTATSTNERLFDCSVDRITTTVGKSESEFSPVTVSFSDLKLSGDLISDQSNSGMADDQDTPVAMPRTRRRKLTKRAISFKKVEEDEYIGFASLPEQVHRKAVRRGFEFTLMVVGETGLGKSTLINSLFLTDLYKDRKVGNTEERVHKTVDLEKKELEIEERGVKLRLTIVDTPGFNDAVNAEESWKPIVNYIDKQFETYFKAESGLNRKNIQDTRVHCCLYFISPYGHGLRPVDVSVMKKLHHKVNIVPLIAKADMLTKQEVRRLKEKVLQEVEHHKLQIYQFPDCDSDEDEDFKQQDKELKKSIPFAVVGSNTVVEAGGKKIRGRMYPWGIVEVENPQHCDFVKLRQMLISTHMQDLKDVTCDIHYENYRAEHITEQMTSTQKERNKLKRDSTPNLDKALDTERLLQEKEQEIKKMQEMLAKMQAQLNNKNNSPQLNGKIGKA